MARAAVLGRLTWRAAAVRAVRDETATARTLVLDVDGWPGHLPGQHVDVRLTADDGYQAQRSYSIAAPAADGAVELTVERLDDGEVSPYLTQVVGPGDALEVRGPVGGWFVWDEDDASPVLLVAGGSGLVPLMAMVRAHARTTAAGAAAPFRLVCSVRSPDALLFADELAGLADSDRLEVALRYTRAAPAGWTEPVGRLDAAALDRPGWRPADAPRVFVCGPTPFVEAVAALLVGAGHDAERIRTERFGGAGGGG